VYTFYILVWSWCSRISLYFYFSIKIIFLFF